MRAPTARSSAATGAGGGARAGRGSPACAGGSAVAALGHGPPGPLAAAHAQLDRLWHVSNLYWSEPMLELAAKLSARFGGAQAFFCNAGAESIEAALKYARKATPKPGVVALEGSFHGRTLGALSVTGQPAKRTAFEPLIPGVSFARLNEPDSPPAARAGGPPPGAGARRGGHPRCDARVPRGSRRARGRDGRAARLRRDPDRGRAHGQ